jgi:hypothetical protein
MIALHSPHADGYEAHNRINSSGVPMKTISITALAGLAFTATQVAHAGAVGAITNVGLHQERAYFYDRQGEQFIESQMRVNTGFGLETLVGDKDEKIQGILRFMWMIDSQPKAPDTGDVLLAQNPDYDALKAKHVGVLGLGVQWGILGDPMDKQLVVNSLVGSGFITTDNTEYVLVEAGVGGTYNLSPTIQATANLALTMRNRKHISFGPNMYMGIRYLFD